MISWTRGAKIGWHSDNNKPYLRQRHYSAVCYLNNHGQDFEGGLFHFQQGEPLTVVPSLGTVVIYTADEQNIHCVDEVQSGERCTLAMWFTRDYLHNEDTRLIRQLSEAFMHSNIFQLEGTSINLVSQYFHHQLQSSSQQQNDGDAKEYTNQNWVMRFLRDGSGALRSNTCMISSTLEKLLLPKAASSTMYWFAREDDFQLEAAKDEIKSRHSITDLLENRKGNNLCELRLACLGFSCYEGEINYPVPTSYHIAKMPLGRHEELPSSSELEGVKLSLNEQLAGLSELESPLMLQFKEEHIPYVFTSWLHALSVVHYFWWRKSVNCLMDDANESNTSSTNTIKMCLDRKENNEVGELVAQPANKLRKQSAFFGGSFQRNKETGTGNLDVERIFHQRCTDLFAFDKHEFLCFIQQWEKYIFDLWRTLLSSFPCWKTSSAIFCVKSQGNLSDANTGCHVD